MGPIHEGMKIVGFLNQFWAQSQAQMVSSRQMKQPHVSSCSAIYDTVHNHLQAQSDKEKKNVIVLTPVYINILIPPWFEGRVDDDDSFFHELNIYFPFIQAQSTWRENLHQHVHDSHLHSVTQTCQPLSGFKALDCEKLLFNV